MNEHKIFRHFLNPTNPKFVYSFIDPIAALELLFEQGSSLLQGFLFQFDSDSCDTRTLFRYSYKFL